VRRILLFAVVLTVATQAMAGTGRMVILNNDPPGQGFNDPTPASPVGGNPGTTLGQQRMHVFRAAADRWQTMLDTDVDILVAARFAPISTDDQPCTATQGILGFAGPARWVHSFAAAPKQGVWYPIALANKLAGRDLAPSVPDINVTFNVLVDNNTCLGNTKWYYGLDRNHGNNIDLFVVVLHELGHGLGIAGAWTPPEFRDNRPAISDVHTIDLTLGRYWHQMSEPERSISITNSGNLAWDGPNVREMAPRFLEPMTTLTITAPAPISRDYDIGLASFGPSANRAAMSGRIVQALDAANPDGPATTDACTPLTNAATINGNIALVDRGSCTFVQKARNAQAAGATGMVIVNLPDSCGVPGMSGDAPDVTIPVISVSRQDGEGIKAQLASNTTVNAMLRVDPSQLAGGTKEGHVRLFAPCENQPGSSRHHWDTTATPNLLMEPSINPDLLHGVDLTIYQLLDMGWTLPPRSGRRMLRR
jgi:hypothetical protein